MVNAKDITVEQAAQIKNVVLLALSNKNLTVTPLNGCGRVYLNIGYGRMNKSSPIADALKKIFLVTKRPYQSGVSFYIGYDNADGHISSTAEFVAKSIKEIGIPSFVDYDAD